ncbi:unnamed protein product [Moneuplotes crassus]|uniref:Uncharacterized protein n=1 Tax=Euplotes crassus TaxID=5936 RepID=A0AAD1XWD0_EUPCR|nr:unnamed protein product [Moneuplotes crassus]
MERFRQSVGREEAPKLNDHRKTINPSRSIEYDESSPLKLPPINKNRVDRSQIKDSQHMRDGSPYSTALREGLSKGKLSNRYKAARIFPTYGCWQPKEGHYQSTKYRLEAKFSEADPTTPSSRQFFHKNDFMKKYTEEMLKAKNMMNDKQ